MPFFVCYQNNLAVVLCQIYIIKHICDEVIELHRFP